MQLRQKKKQNRTAYSMSGGGRGRPFGSRSHKWENIFCNVKEIIAEYDPLQLTIRQIYYRLIAKYGLKKTKSNYTYLSKQLVMRRQLKYINWDRIVDLTRKPTREEYVGSPKSPTEYFEIMLEDFKETIENYHIPLYENQKYLVEIWCEHQGLEPLFKQALKDIHVTLYFTKGRNSWSNFWETYQRLKDTKREIIILHFADLDKYGLEMTENIYKNLKYLGLKLEVKRIAITPQQIKNWNLVDTQLEAIDPTQFNKLIRDSALQYIDQNKYQETWEKINEGRKEIKKIYDENIFYDLS